MKYMILLKNAMSKIASDELATNVWNNMVDNFNAIGNNIDETKANYELAKKEIEKKYNASMVRDKANEMLNTPIPGYSIASQVANTSA